ncbi:DNAj-like protein [Leishmania major strain Friedlin]|uniref:DNAj-like protein n=1 Tax=Leishmania major TaxID=5664 RepID=Q4Q7K0_LEIMA|nr:DNAj-like protein [Leishmania major strain Friedlin]7AM2_BS Chain BS, DNAj-like protein [Leishmania tarentolae]CAG9578299.1 DnaJ_domain-containing_protein/JDP49/J49/mitoribosomal_protein_mL77 [Leishmania major strain Friedlin]CAJ06112.2 DNAj-like protein [Leishmania major strain Friedlin]|eukprot:XP_001684698.2 DNAj-like protein [Leishmania major strain Friedlin]
MRGAPTYATALGSACLPFALDCDAILQASRRYSSTSAHGARSSAAASTSKLNYYRNLGVDTDATPQEVKTAYRQLALKYHPDVVEETHRAHAEMLFRRVSEAYEVLSDPVRRRAHDAELGIQTRRKQQPSATAPAGAPSAANAKAGTRAGSPAGGARPSSAFAERRKHTSSTASSTSSTTFQQQQQQQRRRYRKPFVRGDANRVFSDAFDGKTLDEILFDVQRRRRQEKAGRVAAERRHEKGGGAGHAASNGTTKSSSSPQPLMGESGPLDHDARLRHVMETAAELFAQRAQRQYGHGVLRHIRGVAGPLPDGPAPPPEVYMPFRPFVGMPVPPGVRTPPEPTLGKVLDSQEATVDSSSTPASRDAAWYEIPTQFHTHTYADGTPQSRSASLAKATKYIHGMPHNMGQLYSYHRPY